MRFIVSGNALLRPVSRTIATRTPASQESMKRSRPNMGLMKNRRMYIRVPLNTPAASRGRRRRSQRMRIPA